MDMAPHCLCDFIFGERNDHHLSDDPAFCRQMTLLAMNVRMHPKPSEL
jgi:hypothetical protein